MNRADVVVIGAGVIGLTTAVCLAEAGARVRVLTRDPPQRTTSAAAGAVWAPYRIGGDPVRIRRWGQRSLEVLTALARSGGSGVRMIANIEISHGPVPAPEWWALAPAPRPCVAEELPAGYSHGYRFVVPALDMPVYLAWLLRRLARAGGTLQRQTVTSLDAVRGTAHAIVNCSGTGARELARDAELLPVRGQIVLVVNPGIRVGMVEIEDDEDHGEQTFCIPHGDKLVLGGTIEPYDERGQPDPRTTRAIVARCARLDARLAEPRILAQRVGLRPVRPEVRVGADPQGPAGIWHNYGHGGAGITLSWGCAEEITASVLAR